MVYHKYRFGFCKTPRFALYSLCGSTLMLRQLPAPSVEQRGPEQLVLKSLSCPSVALARSAHPAAPGPQQLLGWPAASREAHGHQPELRGQWEEGLLPGLLGPRWKLVLEKANQYSLHFSSLIFICRILKWRYFLNMGLCLEQPRHRHVDTHTDTHVCTRLPSHICFTWIANRGDEHFEACPSSGFKPTIPWCTLGFFFFFFFLSSLGPYPWHMEVPRLEVESELQLPAYTIATATPNQSHIFSPHHSSWQCWILSPLSEAKDRTWVLVDTSQIHYHWATTRTPCIFVFLSLGFFFIVRLGFYFIEALQQRMYANAFWLRKFCLLWKVWLGSEYGLYLILVIWFSITLQCMCKIPFFLLEKWTWIFFWSEMLTFFFC